jgi:hypothetical protein
MVDIIVPGAPARRSIRVDTRRGTAVDNAQSFEVTHQDQQENAWHQGRFPRAIFRTGVSPVYNCHGLTFASRRTRIAEAQSIRTILTEDDYEEVPRANIQVGDVIVYLSADDDGDIEHSGIVVEVLRPEGFNVPAPRVWSKWGGAAEVVHMYDHCPYSPTNIRFYRVVR